MVDELRKTDASFDKLNYPPALLLKGIERKQQIAKLENCILCKAENNSTGA